MKTSRFVFAVLFASAALCLASCAPEKGPVFVNASGGVAQISTSYDDGHVIEGDLEDGRVLWAGYAGAEISFAVIRVSDVIQRLEASELRQPFPGDKLPAFILKKEGVGKVSFAEFRRAAGKR